MRADLRLVRRLVTLLLDRQQKVQAFGLVCAATLLALLEAVGVGSIVPFVNLLQSPGAMAGTRVGTVLTAVFGNVPHETMLLRLGVALLGVTLAKNLLAAWHSRSVEGFSQEVFRRASTRLLRSYMARPYVFFLDANSAILAKNVTVETKLIAEQIVLPVLLLVSEAWVLIAILAVLVLYNPWVSVVALTFLVTVFGFLYRATTRYNTRLGVVREQTLGQMVKVASEALTGIKDIKVAGTERYFSQMYDAIAAKHARAVMLNNAAQYLPRLVMEAIIVSGVLGMIVFFRTAVAASTGMLATLAMYLVAAYRLMPSANRMIMAMMRLRYVEAGFAAVAPALVETLRRERVPEPRRTPLPFRSELRLEDVHFQYTGGTEDVLAGVTFRVARGEVVGFVGPSGSGKSTLIAVILGLLPVKRGCICVDGRPLELETVPAWQAAAAYVPQHVFVADDTITHNVALGIAEEAIDAERLAAALEVAQLSDLVSSLPEGVNSVVGERGARLSGGQIQRLGLARALYRETPVLIMDEATSALDVETETQILRALHTDRAIRTVLVVAHRHASLRYCDRIYRLENGRLEECLPSELLGQHQGRLEP